SGRVMSTFQSQSGTSVLRWNSWGHRPGVETYALKKPADSLYFYPYTAHHLQQSPYISKSAGQSIGGGNRTYKPRHANYLMRINCYSNVKALPRGPKFIQLSNPITGSIYRLNLVTELYPDQNRRNSLNRPR